MAAAARICEELLAADNCNAPAHYYYALVQQYSGAASEAEQALRRAIDLMAISRSRITSSACCEGCDDTSQCCRSFRNVLGVLGPLADDHPVDPCGGITARELRALATRQLELLVAQAGDA